MAEELDKVEMEGWAPLERGPPQEVREDGVFDSAEHCRVLEVKVGEEDNHGDAP